MNVKSVQLQNAVGLSGVIESKDFEIEVDLEHQCILLKPRKGESYKMRPRIIPFANIASIDGFTDTEERLRADRERDLAEAAKRDAEAMKPDPVTVPVQPDPPRPPENKADVITFKKNEKGEIEQTPTRAVFQKAAQVKTE